ncbi:hypothetical protein ACIBTZ_28550 [Micromonospora sp. NPDC049460]|uniref:hypothetical protein n=1 Tax=Micromonospora sp. NPDC049460 TaxID=3364272 RepID=UPI0037909169
MSIAQYVADTIDANSLPLAVHGFAVEVSKAEPVSPAVHVVPVPQWEVIDGKLTGPARVVIAYPTGQVFPLDHFRAELERVIGKPNAGPNGYNGDQRTPYVISRVVEQADGRIELTLSLGCIA